MITRLIWTIWTPMSSVPKKADKLNLSLFLSSILKCDRKINSEMRAVPTRVGVNSIPELELWLNSNSNSGIGIGIGIEIGGIENGIGIENPGIGIGIGIENWNWIFRNCYRSNNWLTKHFQILASTEVMIFHDFNMPWMPVHNCKKPVLVCRVLCSITTWSMYCWCYACFSNLHVLFYLVSPSLLVVIFLYCPM